MASSVIALIDGEHHPDAVRGALDRLAREREVVSVIFCGGEEKVRREVLDDPARHYGRPVEIGGDVESILRRVAAADGARTVVDLADEPVLGAAAKLRLAATALHLGLDYEGPGFRLEAPVYEPVDFAGPKLAIVGTGKRTGKTAVSCHLAGLLKERGAAPVIVSMGRGGPAEPQVAGPDTGLEELLGLAERGLHAASDYLEDAALAGVPAVGCRRVGGGLAGEPFESNVVEGARVAVGLDPGVLLFEGSGACIPPVEVDRTLCVVGARTETLGELGPYRIMRAQLALVMHGDEGLASEVAELCPGRTIRAELRPEPAEQLPPGARVAVFSTGAGACEVDAIVSSRNLARRAALEQDLELAARERCDVYLTELKAAAIDTVAERARREGARVVFVRNRPVGVGADLDAALLALHDDVRGRIPS